jgi:hypothetical protein
MAVISDATWQGLIVQELQADATELVVPPSLSLIVELWSTYQQARMWDPDKFLVGNRLTYLYTKRAAIDYMLENAWQDTTSTEEGIQEGDNDRFKQLKVLRDQFTADIVSTEKRAVGSRPPAVAQMTTTAPGFPFDVYQPAPALPDPSSSLYRGDPIRRFAGTGGTIL